MNKKVNNNVSYEDVLVFLKEITSIPDETKVIYQYTNIEALFNGIIVKAPNKIDEDICLWASHYKYLNDPSEIVIGLKYFEEILNYFIEKENNETKIDSIDDADYFITSFSTTIDSLPMWNMYGKNGTGIALGFDSDIIHKKNNESFLYKCVYLDKEIRDKITYFCESYKGEKIKECNLKMILLVIFGVVLYSLFKDEKPTKEFMADNIMPFWQFMSFAKNAAYKYENEVRLLIQPDKESEIKYRCQNNLIIPYMENFFPRKALKEIWVGPTNDMGRTEKSLKTYLDYMGFSDVEIKQSEVPYRI